MITLTIVLAFLSIAFVSNPKDLSLDFDKRIVLEKGNESQVLDIAAFVLNKDTYTLFSECDSNAYVFAFDGKLMHRVTLPFSYTDTIFPIQKDAKQLAVTVPGQSKIYKLSRFSVPGSVSTFGSPRPHKIYDGHVRNNKFHVIAGIMGHINIEGRKGRPTSRLTVSMEYDFANNAFTTPIEIPLMHKDYVFIKHLISPNGKRFIAAVFRRNEHKMVNTSTTCTLAEYDSKTHSLNFFGEREYSILTGDAAPSLMWVTDSAFIYANYYDHGVYAEDNTFLFQIPNAIRASKSNSNKGQVGPYSEVINIFKIGDDKLGVFLRYSPTGRTGDLYDIYVFDSKTYIHLGSINVNEIGMQYERKGEELNYICEAAGDNKISFIVKDNDSVMLDTYTLRVGDIE